MTTKISKSIRSAIDKEMSARAKAANLVLGYLKKMIDKYQNIEFNYDFDDEYVSICYDGGNHPEYASTMYSQAQSVYKEDNSYLVECEDGFMEIEDLLFDDIIAIADAVEVHFINLKNNE